MPKCPEPIRMWDLIGAALLIWAVAVGCTDAKTPAPPEVFMQVNERVVTVDEFHQAVDEATATFNPDQEADAAVLTEFKLRILNQLAERMVLLERAQELDIHISDEELDARVASIKSDYPKGEFKQVLIEQAVSYPQWKNDLRIRLLMEKVVNHELDPKVEVTPEELSVYYEKHYATSEGAEAQHESPADIDTLIVQQVRNSKKEALYRDWLAALKKKYTLTVNQDAWERIMARP